jgi:hypothetical protein
MIPGKIGKQGLAVAPELFPTGKSDCKADAAVTIRARL